ncbi:MAG: DUF6650 family protein [Planctomycetota bacterium]
MGGKLEVKAAELASRLSSVSILGIGIGFKPQETERSVLRELFIFLEDRRALTNGATWEQPEHVTKSVDKIRDKLTASMVRLKSGSPAYKECSVMRAACRDFLNATSHGGTPHARSSRVDHNWEHFFIALGGLRATFGQCIAVLGHLYIIDIDSELVLILPPIVDEKGRVKKKAMPKKG